MMKDFKREIIILIIIIILIFSIDIITSNIMKSVTQEIITDISNLSNVNQEQKVKEMINIKKRWEEKEERLSFFTEHDELEKVTSEIISLDVNIKNNMEEEAKESISKIKFLLEHIEDKEKLKMKNIF